MYEPKEFSYNFVYIFTCGRTFSVNQITMSNHVVRSNSFSEGKMTFFPIYAPYKDYSRFASSLINDPFDKPLYMKSYKIVVKSPFTSLCFTHLIHQIVAELFKLPFIWFNSIKKTSYKAAVRWHRLLKKSLLLKYSHKLELPSNIFVNLPLIEKHIENWNPLSLIHASIEELLSPRKLWICR
jgi:hypothetical protein